MLRNSGFPIKAFGNDRLLEDVKPPLHLSLKQALMMAQAQNSQVMEAYMGTAAATLEGAH